MVLCQQKKERRDSMCLKCGSDAYGTGIPENTNGLSLKVKNMK
jgi:hypothetical protein